MTRVARPLTTPPTRKSFHPAGQNLSCAACFLAAAEPLLTQPPHVGPQAINLFLPLGKPFQGS